MKNFKKMAIALGVIAPVMAFSQTAPTGAPPANNVNSQARAAWYRGGNFLVNGANNIFGTMAGFNSPIYTYTNGIARSVLSGNRTSTINGYTINNSGYMGLGRNSTQSTSSLPGSLNNGIWNDLGPYSLLHLNGNQNFVQEEGYRPWMKTGVTFTDNVDMSYIGLRAIDGVVNKNEFVMLWSNNAATNASGPDDMVFRFTDQGNGNNNINTGNLLDNGDLDGLHIARFTGTGEFGLGNTFGMGNPIYVRPTSLQHLSLSNNRSVYTQFTNRNTAVGSGTGETTNDGLRIGIHGNNNPPAGASLA